MIKSLLLLSFVVLFLTGCQHPSIQKSTQTDLLFPNGNYQQDVVVRVLAKGHEKDFDFNCLVQKNPDSLHLVGYNSFGMSLFKIKEANGEIKMESSISQINEKKDFFLKVFSLVKTLINIKKDDPKVKNDSLEVDFQNIKSQVHFKDFDQVGVPLKIEIQSSEVMQISIVTTQYTFK